MIDNRIKGFFWGMGALGFVATSLMVWEGGGFLVVISLMGVAVSFAMSLMFLFSKKLVEQFQRPLFYAGEGGAERLERTYSKEAEMVRAAQLRHGIRTVNLTGLDFDLLEIAGEVVREAVAAERKLWMKKSKRGVSR